MLELVFVVVVPRLVEVVHVELDLGATYLADERSEVVVLERLGQDLLGELVNFLHDEGGAILVPGDDVLIDGVLEV